MKRILVAAAVLTLGVSAVVAQQDVAVQQQNQMKDQGKYMYGVVLKMVKGDTPFDQAAAECDCQLRCQVVHRAQQLLGDIAGADEVVQSCGGAE